MFHKPFHKKKRDEFANLHVAIRVHCSFEFNWKAYSNHREKDRTLLNMVCMYMRLKIPLIGKSVDQSCSSIAVSDTLLHFASSWTVVYWGKFLCLFIVKVKRIYHHHQSLIPSIFSRGSVFCCFIYCCCMLFHAVIWLSVPGRKLCCGCSACDSHCFVLEDCYSKIRGSPRILFCVLLGVWCVRIYFVLAVKYYNYYV